MNSKRTRWQSAFSKSMLMMFIAQLLLSAACISTANADSMSRNVSATAHCHNQSVVGSYVDDASHATKQDMSACSHCDTPDMSISASTPSVTGDMVPVFLAIIMPPEMPVLSTSDMSILVDDNALPHSFSLLYQTTQRILI